jgi:S-adenosyl methyltransferase
MTDRSPASADHVSKLDTGVPHGARTWNYWLGGKDNFAIDREVGDRVRAVYPEIVEVARAARAFLVRAVTYLAGEVGVGQFLDIGAGLPTADNTHEVAQRVAPTCRVVYVDNDPLVLVHARALIASGPERAIDYVDADMHDVDKILREAARTLDFSQPAAVMMLGVLGYAGEYDQARSIVRRLLDAMPSGSYLVVDDGVKTTEGSEEGVRVANAAGVMYRLRTFEQIAGFLDGLELVDPCVVPAARCGPSLVTAPVPAPSRRSAVWGGNRNPGFGHPPRRRQLSSAGRRRRTQPGPFRRCGSGRGN